MLDRIRRLIALSSSLQCLMVCRCNALSLARNVASMPHGKSVAPLPHLGVLVEATAAGLSSSRLKQSPQTLTRLRPRWQDGNRRPSGSAYFHCPGQMLTQLDIHFQFSEARSSLRQTYIVTRPTTRTLPTRLRPHGNRAAYFAAIERMSTAATRAAIDSKSFPTPKPRERHTVMPMKAVLGRRRNPTDDHLLAMLAQPTWPSRQ